MSQTGHLEFRDWMDDNMVRVLPGFLDTEEGAKAYEEFVVNVLAPSGRRVPATMEDLMGNDKLMGILFKFIVDSYEEYFIDYAYYYFQHLSEEAEGMYNKGQYD